MDSGKENVMVALIKNRRYESVDHKTMNYIVNLYKIDVVSDATSCLMKRRV